MKQVESNTKKNPKISIVTVVLNDAENIVKTVNSISELTYNNTEYIVIDGGSTDSTLKVIDNFKYLIDKYVSDKDDGLYDAMNKGIELASGEWIIFMNAGDVFATNEIINRVFEGANYDGVDILYGDTIVSYPEFEKYRPSGSIVDIKQGMQFSHQSAFIRLDYHKRNKYKIQNRICADFEFFYDASKQNKIFLKIFKTISSVLIGGISDKNRELVFLSWWKVVGIGNIKLNIIYSVRILSALFKRIIKVVLPSRIIYFIIRNK
jgi:glycosyltransferase involved in cell wall biosynthesis